MPLDNGPVDYRQLQSPVQPLTPDELPNTGRAQEAEALAGLFKSFSNTTNNLGIQVGKTKGEQAAGADASSGNINFKSGIARYTAYGEAYNNAAARSYLIETSVTADSQAAQLQIEANKNPDTFRTTFSAARDATLKHVPIEAQKEVADMYNTHLAQGLANVTAAHQQDIVDRQRSLVDVDIGVSTNKIGKLQADAMITGNPTSMAMATDENNKLFLRIQGAVNSGTISQVEADGRIAAAHRTIFENTWTSQFEHELQTNPDPQAALKIIDKFQAANRNNAVLSEDEEHKLTLRMFTDLKEQNLVVAKLKSLNKTDEQTKYDNGDKLFTGLYLTGQLTEAALAKGVANSDVRPERATALVQLMKNAAVQAKSSPEAILKLKTDPQFLDKTDIEIASTPGVNATDALKAIDERDKRNNSYEGTQEFKDGVAAINRALKITPGPTGLLSDADRKRQTDALGDYHDAVKNTDPAKRTVNMSTLAQQAIEHANTRAAAADLQTYIDGKARYLKNNGPGSLEYAGDKAYADRLKQYDDHIAAARSASSSSGSK